VSVYKLAGTATGGTENALAQLDIQFDGLITAIHGAMRATIAANTEFAQTEISFISTNTVGSNDTRGSLFMMKAQIALLTSGVANTGVNVSIGGLAVVVTAGERLWMHTVNTASKASVNDVYVYVEDGQGVPTAQRRR